MEIYRIEKYTDEELFGKQYRGIHTFLEEQAGQGENEHFHWGRFSWMMQHSMLQPEYLNKIGIFKNEQNKIVGVVTYDTELDDNTYLIHSSDDKRLVEMMLTYAMKNYAKDGNVSIAVNSKDKVLEKLVREKDGLKTDWKDQVLELSLHETLDYKLPENYNILPKGSKFNGWRWNEVIVKGFGGDVNPEDEANWNGKCAPHFNEDLQVLVVNEQGTYCACCGIWYEKGETAYIEPVVTLEECRKQGLAKAAVYEACKRVEAMGAKRAIVLSEQEFYKRIGFRESSQFAHWNVRV